MLTETSSKRRRVENDSRMLHIFEGPNIERNFNLQIDHARSRNLEEKLAESNRRLYRQYKSDQHKLVAFENHIKSLELELESSKMDIELLSSKLRDYEPGNDPSLAQVLWCEKHLKASLQQVTDLKVMLLTKDLSSSKGQLKFQSYQEQLNHKNKEMPHQQNQMNMQASAPSLYGCRRNGIINRLGAKELSNSNGVVIGNSSNNYRSNLTLAASSSQSIHQSAGMSFPNPQAQISPASHNIYAPIQRQGMSSMESNQPYSSILNRQSGTTPSLSAHFREGAKKVDMFTISHKNNLHNLTENWISSCQKIENDPGMKDVIMSSSGNKSTSYHNIRSTRNSSYEITQNDQTGMKEVTNFSSDNNNASHTNLKQHGNSTPQIEEQMRKGKTKVNEVHESNSWWDDGPAMAKMMSSKDFVF